MERPLDPAVENMHEVEPATVGLIVIHCQNVMASLLKPFSSFADLDAITATPLAGRSVIDQKDSHGAQCYTDILSVDGDAGVKSFVT